VLGLESLLDVVSSSPWTYAGVLGVAAFDPLVPLVPSETAVIAAGVLAAAGDLQIAFVVAAGAAGAYLGDTSAYWLGRSLGGRLDRSLFRGERAARRRVWAERALDRHGGPLLLGARFVPGGRTATTLTAGVVRMRWLRFAFFAAVAAIVWASYAGLAGYVGGRAFEGRPLLALAVGFGVAAAVYAAVELGRFARRRARPDAAGASGGGLAPRPHGVSSASAYVDPSVRASELERRP
jgi:membrane protein DedA with SNARE-associated domain